MSPFFALRSLHSQINFDIVDILDTTTYERINKKKAIDIAKTM